MFASFPQTMNCKLGAVSGSHTHTSSLSGMKTAFPPCSLYISCELRSHTCWNSLSSKALKPEEQDSKLNLVILPLSSMSVNAVPRIKVFAPEVHNLIHWGMNLNLISSAVLCIFLRAHNNFSQFFKWEGILFSKQESVRKCSLSKFRGLEMQISRELQYVIYIYSKFWLFWIIVHCVFQRGENLYLSRMINASGEETYHF